MTAGGVEGRNKDKDKAVRYNRKRKVGLRIANL